MNFAMLGERIGNFEEYEELRGRGRPAGFSNGRVPMTVYLDKTTATLLSDLVENKSGLVRKLIKQYLYKIVKDEGDK